jgi:hypothetical protein
MHVVVPDTVVPIPLRSPAQAAMLLREQLVSCRGGDSQHDPGIDLSVDDVLELVSEHDACLLAVIRPRDADPALLFGQRLVLHAAGTAAVVADLAQDVEDTQPGVAQTVRTEGPDGRPVLLVERVPTQEQLRQADRPTWQLQAVVFDPAAPRAAVFQLVSTTGRSWPELIETVAPVILGVEFD